jgi:hypothetical protein
MSLQEKILDIIRDELWSDVGLYKADKLLHSIMAVIEVEYGWHKVSELPDEEKYYDCWNGKNERRLLFDENKGFVNTFGQRVTNITHWRKLPEPPKANSGSSKNTNCITIGGYRC